MTLAELFKALIEEPDQMARMQLVEDNPELMTDGAEPTDNTEQITTLQTQLTDMTTQYNDLKKKYIDRFFGGKAEDEPKDDPTEEPDPDLSYDELIKNATK